MSEPDPERCPVCGQPDNCGDCDHTPVLCPECKGEGEVTKPGTATRNEWGVWDRDTMPCPSCQPDPGLVEDERIIRKFDGN
jgi:hypothetical protein